MLTKNRHGWDIRIGDGEGCFNIKRHELEELQIAISCAMINEDFDHNGNPVRKEAVCSK